MVGRKVSPVIFGLLLCTWGAVTVGAATLNGRVMNRTLDRAEAGVVVQLVYHSAQTAEVLVDTTNVDGDFAFELSEEPSADVALMLSAQYEDVPYRLDGVTDLSSPVEIAVYESTDQDDHIQMISHHLIVDAQSRQVTQILIFQNTGDRTFKTGTGHGHGLEMPLPEGVTEVESDIPGVHTHGSTLVDSRPVPPGRMQLSFTTPLPANGRLSQHIKYATPSIDAFITPADLEVFDVSMTDLGSINMGERRYRRLMTENVEAGGHISFRLGGTFTSAVASEPDLFDGGGKGPWALGGVALGALLAIAYLKMGHRDTPTFAFDGDLGPEIRRTALIEQIADLDDRLEHGDIAKDEHGRRRDALKAEVVDLTRVPAG